MGAAPVVVSQTTTCLELIGLFRHAQASSAIITGSDEKPVGIITEQDVVRKIAFQSDPATQVGGLMSRPVHTINEMDYLYHGLARMRRLRLRHMPVVNAAGRAVGILEQHEVLAAASATMLGQVERLTHEDTLEGMKETKVSQVKVASELFENHVPAPEVQRLLTSINNDLYKRIVKRCLIDMQGDDWGAPPVEFDVIVMGSGGRGESFLGPDQDNGFVVADYPDQDHYRIDAWFIELAQRMTIALDTVGFDLCPGNVMATNPLWRKTLSQWKKQVDIWIGKSAGTILRLCDIFFDYAPVYGDGTMSAQLRDHVTKIARHPFLLREMYKVDEVHGVALGAFSRLQLDNEPGPGKGKVNLKTTGTLPLVGSIRLFAMREGIAPTSTLSRIELLHKKGILDANENDYLHSAFRHITNLLLRQQIIDFDAGRPPSKHVSPSDLTKREQSLLVDSLRAIKDFRSRVRAELTAEIF